jgi:hypothetical protein
MGMTTVRAAMHVHSRWSYDGKWELPAVPRLFGKLGYGAVFMTEHDRGFHASRWAEFSRACADASTAGTILVPGIEYSDAENIVHVLVWGQLPFLGERRPTLALLEDVNELGGIAVLAHPSRKSAHRLVCDSWLRHLCGIEVWNRKTDGWAPSIDGVLLNQRSGLRAFVGLDFHCARQLFPLAMNLRVSAPVSAAELVRAVTLGECEATVLGLAPSRFTDGPLAAPSRAAERSRQALRRIASATGLFARKVGRAERWPRAGGASFGDDAPLPAGVAREPA